MAIGGMSKQSGGPLDNLANAAQQATGALKQGVAQSQQTTSGEMGQLQQTMKQQQGQVQQGVINRGLGNTSVANTLAQVPMNTYNLASANVQNQGSDRLAQLYAQLAQLKLQGGEDQFQGGLGLGNQAISSAAQQAAAPPQITRGDTPHTL